MQTTGHGRRTDLANSFNLPRHRRIANERLMGLRSVVVSNVLAKRFAERFVLSIKAECLRKMVFFGEQYKWCLEPGSVLQYFRGRPYQRQ